MIASAAGEAATSAAAVLVFQEQHAGEGRVAGARGHARCAPAVPGRGRDGRHPITSGLPAIWMHHNDELYATLRGPGKNMTILRPRIPTRRRARADLDRGSPTAEADLSHRRGPRCRRDELDRFLTTLQRGTDGRRRERSRRDSGCVSERARCRSSIEPTCCGWIGSRRNEWARTGRRHGVLGIDIGTTGSRALVSTRRPDRVRSAEHEAFPVAPDRWAEQDPRLCGRVRPRSVARSTLPGRASPRSRRSACPARCRAPCLMDAAGAVLRPAIIWCDQRTKPSVRWIESTIGASRLPRADVQPGADQLH